MLRRLKRLLPASVKDRYHLVLAYLAAWLIIPSDYGVAVQRAPGAALQAS